MSSPDPHHHDREPKMESLNGPVVLAVLLFGALAYWLVTRPPHEEAHDEAPAGQAARAPAHTPRPPTRVEPTPAPPPSPVAAIPPTGGDCAATITTDPAGADVVWGEQVLGKTPLAKVVVPCGPTKLQLKHPLYSDIEREVVASPGRPFVFEQKLVPGKARLDMTTFPTGAQVEVNGRAVGSGTASFVGTIGEEVTITANLAGHKPYKRDVKLVARRMDLTIELEKE